MVQYLHFRILQFPFTEWWLTITKVITRTYDWWDDLRLPGHPSWNGDLNRSGTLHSGTRARELKHRQEDHRTTDGAETSLHEGIGNVARSCLSAKRCPGRDGKREFDRWICGARSFVQLHWMALIRHQRCADKRAVCSCSFCHVCFSHVKKCCSKYVSAISGLSTWLLLTSAHVVWRYPEHFTGQALELWFHRRRDAGLTPGVQHQMEHFLRPPEICMPIPIGSMYGTYANIWGILMVNVTIYSSTMDPMGYSSTLFFAALRSSLL